jgi:hypothetical protein
MNMNKSMVVGGIVVISLFALGSLINLGSLDQKTSNEFGVAIQVGEIDPVVDPDVSLTVLEEPLSKKEAEDPIYFDGFLEFPYKLDFIISQAPNFENAAAFYSKHLQLAEEGDDMSMFHVYLMENFCSYRIAGKTGEEQERLIMSDMGKSYNENFIDETIYSTLANKYRTCVDVWNLMADEKIDWWDRALEARNPIAILMEEQRIGDPKQRTNEKTNKLLGAAVSKKEPFAMALTAPLYGGKERTNDQIVLKNAWNYLGCQYRKLCSLDKVEKNMRQQFHEYQVDEMLNEASELGKLIENGKIIDHDFYGRLTN